MQRAPGERKHRQPGEHAHAGLRENGTSQLRESKHRESSERKYREPTLDDLALLSPVSPDFISTASTSPASVALQAPTKAMPAMAAPQQLELWLAKLRLKGHQLRSAQCEPQDVPKLINQVNELRHRILTVMTANPQARVTADTLLRDASRQANDTFARQAAGHLGELDALDERLGRVGLQPEAIAAVARTAGAAIVAANGPGQQIATLKQRLDERSTRYQNLFVDLAPRTYPQGFRTKLKIFLKFNRIESQMLETADQEMRAESLHRIKRVGTRTTHDSLARVARSCQELVGSALQVTQAPPAMPAITKQLAQAGVRFAQGEQRIGDLLARAKAMEASRALIQGEAAGKPLTKLQQGAMDYLALQIRHHHDQAQAARRALAAALASFMGDMPRSFDAHLDQLQNRQSLLRTSLAKVTGKAEAATYRLALDSTRDAIDALIGHASAWTTALEAAGRETRQGTRHKVPAELSRHIDNARAALNLRVALARQYRTAPRTGTGRAGSENAPEPA